VERVTYRREALPYGGFAQVASEVCVFIVPCW